MFRQILAAGAVLCFATSAWATPNSNIQTILDHVSLGCSDMHSTVFGATLNQGGADWAPLNPKITAISDSQAVATGESYDGKYKLRLTFTSYYNQDVEVELRFDLEKGGKHYSASGETQISSKTLSRFAANDQNMDGIYVGAQVNGSVPEAAEDANDYGAEIIRKAGFTNADFVYEQVNCRIFAK